MTEPADGDIRCCFKECAAMTPRRETDDYARVKGWHIYRWSSLYGEERESAICPEHAGNRRREAPQPLEGEEPLW